MRVVKVALLALLGVFVLVGVVVVFDLFPARRFNRAAIVDSNNVREIVWVVAETRTLPMKDGVFDPYDFVRQGRIPRRDWSIVRSERSNTGPTDEEIERGDYANFPWERYRGDGTLEGGPFPLLWEKRPDDEGKLLVGLSDGTAVFWDAATLEAALRNIAR